MKNASKCCSCSEPALFRVLRAHVPNIHPTVLVPAVQDASQKAAAAQSLAQQKHQEARDVQQLAHAAQVEAELLRDASGHVNHVASAASAARKWQRKVCNWH